MPQVRAIQEPQDIVVAMTATIVDLLNALRQAVDLVDVNVAAGIAHETMRGLVG